MTTRSFDKQNVLFGTKYAVPRQIKPGILKLTTRRGQSKLSIVFMFVSCEEKYYCRVISVLSQLTAVRTVGAAAVCKERIP